MTNGISASNYEYEAPRLWDEFVGREVGDAFERFRGVLSESDEDDDISVTSDTVDEDVASNYPLFASASL